MIAVVERMSEDWHLEHVSVAKNITTTIIPATQAMANVVWLISTLETVFHVEDCCVRARAEDVKRLASGTMEHVKASIRSYRHHYIPNSFFVKLSNCRPSDNLYVSQHTSMGTECCFAIIATNAVPARENTAHSNVSSVLQLLLSRTQ